MADKRVVDIQCRYVEAGPLQIKRSEDVRFVPIKDGAEAIKEAIAVIPEGDWTSIDIRYRK